MPVDASKKKAATTDTETTETDTTKQDDKDKKETSTTTTRVTSSAKPKDGEISKVIVESYEIEGDTSPGDEFTIKVTIQNTSSQFDAKDIVGLCISQTVVFISRTVRQMRSSVPFLHREKPRY